MPFSFCRFFIPYAYLFELSVTLARYQMCYSFLCDANSLVFGPPVYQGYFCFLVADDLLVTEAAAQEQGGV